MAPSGTLGNHPRMAASGYHNSQSSHSLHGTKMKISTSVLLFNLAVVLVWAPASANDDPTSDAVKGRMELKDNSQGVRKMKQVDHAEPGAFCGGTTTEEDVGPTRRQLKAKKMAPTTPPDGPCGTCPS